MCTSIAINNVCFINAIQIKVEETHGQRLHCNWHILQNSQSLGLLPFPAASISESLLALFTVDWTVTTTTTGVEIFHLADRRSSEQLHETAAISTKYCCLLRVNNWTPRPHYVNSMQIPVDFSASAVAVIGGSESMILALHGYRNSVQTVFQWKYHKSSPAFAATDCLHQLKEGFRFLWNHRLEHTEVKSIA